jgi:hypothetical protein
VTYRLVETRPTRFRIFAAANRVSSRRQDLRASSLHRRILPTLLLVLLSSIGASTVVAEESSRDEMRSLDDEERLLYPSNTQLAMFVSLSEGETLRLDSMQIQIDGELVAHHIYSFKELEALQKGGVQRIYTGNIPTGEHRLDVSIAGKLPGGGAFDGTESFSISKDAQPRLVGITLSGTGGDPGVRVEDW